MREEIYIDKIPKKVINNQVLVGVEDTFDGFTSNGGIKLVNLTEKDSWGDSKEFNISEFVMRHGKVRLVPKSISMGSFSYATDVEIKPGDAVFWNLISFQNHIPLVYNNSLYLLVDYHEIIARERDGVITPINGYALFTPVSAEEKYLDYRINKAITTKWRLEVLPEKQVVHAIGARTAADIWDVGDVVQLLVGASPFKLEGTIKTSLDKNYFACPVNFIICSA